MNTGAFDGWYDFKEQTVWEGREVCDATLGSFDFIEAFEGFSVSDRARLMFEEGFL